MIIFNFFLILLDCDEPLFLFCLHNHIFEVWIALFFTLFLFISLFHCCLICCIPSLVSATIAASPLYNRHSVLPSERPLISMRNSCYCNYCWHRVNTSALNSVNLFLPLSTRLTHLYIITHLLSYNLLVLRHLFLEQLLQFLFMYVRSCPTPDSPVTVFYRRGVSVLNVNHRHVRPRELLSACKQARKMFIHVHTWACLIRFSSNMIVNQLSDVLYL